MLQHYQKTIMEACNLFELKDTTTKKSQKEKYLNGKLGE